MGGLTAAQSVSDEDEDTTRGIIMAEVYLRASMAGWCDPSCSLTVDDEVYTISELDKKEWALLFEPRVVQAEPDLAERTLLLKIESWEQPTNQCKEVYFKLLRKYVKLVVEDEEDDGDEEGDAAAAVAPALVKRKIDSIVWQKGRGNSYVARACNITQDGKMDRTKLTDYKLEATLMDLIIAGTTAGFNQGVNFIDAVDMAVPRWPPWRRPRRRPGSRGRPSRCPRRRPWRRPGSRRLPRRTLKIERWHMSKSDRSLSEKNTVLNMFFRIEATVRSLKKTLF